MKILDSINYTVSIPTDVEELDTMLDVYTYDWAVVLDFLCAVANKQGLHIDKRAVAHKMAEKYGLGE